MSGSRSIYWTALGRGAIKRFTYVCFILWYDEWISNNGSSSPEVGYCRRDSRASHPSSLGQFLLIAEKQTIWVGQPFRNSPQPETECPTHSTRNLHPQPALWLWLNVFLQHAEGRPTRNSLPFLPWELSHSWEFSEQILVLSHPRVSSSERPLE